MSSSCSKFLYPPESAGIGAEGVPKLWADLVAFKAAFLHADRADFESFNALFIKLEDGPGEEEAAVVGKSEAESGDSEERKGL